MKRFLWLPVAALLAVPATASAALPTFHTHSIVVGKSVAGVSLGMRASRAIRAWGGNPTCSGSSSVCGWNNNSLARYQQAELFFAHGKVVGIELSTYTSSRGTAVCRPPLSRLKSVKKAGLCTTERQLRHDYPTIKVNGGLLTLGQGKTKTVFLFPGIATATSRVVTVELGQIFS